MRMNSERSVMLLISVDTEEDNWRPATDHITVDNIKEIPRFQEFVARMGLKPTYFTTYQVARVEWAAALLKQAAQDGAAEMAAHLHPWNTPPLERDPFGANTMTKNLPPALQKAKLLELTRQHEAAFGASPVSFRAGRYGLGHQLVKPLVECGYKVESSVTPFWDWRDYDDGPDFRVAPMTRYHLNQDGTTVVHNAEKGRLVELPLSCGYNRKDFVFWSRLDRAMRSKVMRSTRLAGLAWRTGLLRRIMLNPEIHTVEEMLALSGRLINRGLDYLQVTLHSSSLRPGLSPFTPTAAEVNRLYERIDRYVGAVSKLATPVPAVVADFATVENIPEFA